MRAMVGKRDIVWGVIGGESEGEGEGKGEVGGERRKELLRKMSRIVLFWVRVCVRGSVFGGGGDVEGEEDDREEEIVKRRTSHHRPSHLTPSPCHPLSASIALFSCGPRL